MLKIDFSEVIGSIKPMNAVNNGPAYTKNADQNSGNLGSYTAARIPYARTHDASFFPKYGGYHTVDVHVIFPDFNADPDDPANYDFQLTDEYMEAILAAGTKVFYRLGAKIEHESKHYGILPPPDPKKWAVICEHIIAHMNEGWAEGHHFGIEYWEIWNEPDLYGKCWLGTPEQFYELFAVTAKHLKARFPNIKIGGPAVTKYKEEWLIPFFTKMQAEGVPMDFYSWHCYGATVDKMTDAARKHRALADRFGYTEAESILNEWNYVRGWKDEDWIYTLTAEKGMKGAAFIAGVMSGCQDAPVDMLMYYDARPNSGMNGMYDMVLLTPIKGYYPIQSWGRLASMGEQCRVTGLPKDIYVTAARSAEGERAALVTYFSDGDEALPVGFAIDAPGCTEITIKLLDRSNDMKPIERVYCDGIFELKMTPNSVLWIDFN